MSGGEGLGSIEISLCFMDVMGGRKCIYTCMHGRGEREGAGELNLWKEVGTREMGSLGEELARGEFMNLVALTLSGFRIGRGGEGGGMASLSTDGKQRANIHILIYDEFVLLRHTRYRLISNQSII